MDEVWQKIGRNILTDYVSMVFVIPMIHSVVFLAFFCPYFIVNIQEADRKWEKTEER